MKTLLLMILTSMNCFASQTIIAKGDVSLVSYFIELPNGAQEATVQVVQRFQNDDICDDAWLEGSVDEIKTARWGAVVDMYMADMSLSSFSWCKTQTKRDVVVKSREFKITKSAVLSVFIVVRDLSRKPMHCRAAWQLARDHFHPVGGGRRSSVFNPAT